MGVILNKDQILAAKDWTGETVTVEEWGGDVCIRAMSGAARDAFRSSTDENAGKGLSKFQASFLALTLVDEAGNQMFTLDEVEVLRGRSAAVLDKLTQIALRVNGMTAEAREDALKN